MAGSAFDSEALRVNLDRTRAVDVELPEDHAWLLAQAQRRYGIHKRLDAFFRELHHPYANARVLVSEFRKIVLEDRWFFAELEHASRAFEVLRDIFARLLDMPVERADRERCLQTLIEFLSGIARGKPLSAEARAVIESSLDVFEAAIARDDFLFARASSYIKTLGAELARIEGLSGRMQRLLATALEKNLAQWRETADLERWLAEHRRDFQADHGALAARLGRGFFDELAGRLAAARDWAALDALVDFSALADRFRALMDEVESPFDRAHYILYLVRLPGMAHLVDQLLWDLNRAFRSLSEASSPALLIDFVDGVFGRFDELKSEHMGTVLDCVLTLGKEVYATGERALIDRLIDRLIDLGFVHPSAAGIGEDWQLQTDPNHVKNIRVWLELFELEPSVSLRLLSALLVQLKIGGVFISDTDLFQKDVSRLLNSGIDCCFELIQQLGPVFPVYFNVIGAEGELREVTTALDELSHRQDRLIHFLRKQIHTESNNTHADLVARIAHFWHTGEDGELAGMLPADVREQMPRAGRWFEPAQRLVRSVCEQLGTTPEALLELPAERLQAAAEACADPGVDALDRKRLALLARLFVLLKQKYSLDPSGVVPSMRAMAALANEEIQRFESVVSGTDAEAALEQVFALMERLRAIVLDAKRTEGHEDIYHKRHVAAGIPSMYGRYSEPKFAAFGLSFRLQSLATQLLQQLVDQTHMAYVCGQSLRRIARILDFFSDGLKLVGISDESFDSHLEMLHYSLTTPSFSIGQFINLFQFLANNIKQVIQDFFMRPHEESLRIILEQRLAAEGLEGEALLKAIHKRTEAFYRDLLATAFLVQPLDSFVSSVLDALNTMNDRLSPEIIQGVMSFDRDLVICPLDEPVSELDNRVFLGAKAFFLKRLHAFRFPIPHGFVLTTELFRRRRAIWSYDELRRDVIDMIAKGVAGLEHKAGYRFGYPDDPLLLSVRSGAAISMPGAMNTFLNVGINDEIIDRFSHKPGYAWAAWDCYRRFLQVWGMAHHLPRDDFDEIILGFKQRYGIERKMRFTPDQMKQIALAYKELLLDNGVQFERDPHEQLVQAVLLVLDSWYGERAKVYRRQLQIADEWGTAVIIQSMVLGNIGNDSGTGVVFTRDPLAAGQDVTLYGDFTVRSQGEDVVAGLVHTLPVSERQRLRSFGGDISLENHFPEIYTALDRYAHDLIDERGYGHQEIEFTFETHEASRLFILQTRDYEPKTGDRWPVFAGEEVESELLGRGIGVGGGAMNGVVAFDMGDLVRYTRQGDGLKRILVRPDTVPDDIGMIFECDGLLTSRGGATSHAAVTASRLGKTCVVNCRALHVREDVKTCSIGGQEFQSGDPIAIDGRLGTIYRGHHRIELASIDAP
ncbi:MAG: hypothetical protein JXR96_23025 [Deltaproteobacteria bacterium]|nr:hypothetical protein [Deltaproteobacteria bacterium]